jgi:hypothetical protein
MRKFWGSSVIMDDKKTMQKTKVSNYTRLKPYFIPFPICNGLLGWDLVCITVHNGWFQQVLPSCLQIAESAATANSDISHLPMLYLVYITVHNGWFNKFSQVASKLQNRLPLPIPTFHTSLMFLLFSESPWQGGSNEAHLVYCRIIS